MTVAENLEMGAFAYRADPADVRRRIDHVVGLFGDLANRPDQLAGSLSGGQQQMLALAMTLLHEPEVLLIDELSLGLAPVVVQDLLGIVAQLKASGMTIVIVEQSLNIALPGVRPRRVPREGPGPVRGPGRRTGPARRPRARGVPRSRGGPLIASVLAMWITRQLVVDGVVNGLLYALLAMSIILVYRATRVDQLRRRGHGPGRCRALRPPGSRVERAVLVSLVPIVLVVGIVYGAVLELVVVRRLFQAPRVILLVATVGMAQLSC